MGEHRPRWRALAIGLLVLALLTVMYVTSQPREGLTAGERFLRDMLAPVETAFSSVTHRVRGTAERFRSWRALQEQNEALRQEVVALRIRNQMLEEAWRENQVLRAMVGLVQEGGHPLVTGLVIGRPVSNWWSQVTINRGRRDGVAPRMPVVTADGAVGWVLSVSERTAEVMLLVDARSAVGAMVQRTGVPVVVEGAASEGIPRLRLRALVAGADLRVGDVVVTSGFSQIFPTGVRVGRIAEVLPTPSGRAAEAWLEPAVDFSRLEMVGVLLSPEGAPGGGRGGNRTAGFSRAAGTTIGGRPGGGRARCASSGWRGGGSRRRCGRGPVMAYEGGDQYAWAKRGGLILLGLLWVLLLQRAVLSHLPLWGVRPDLPLVATVVIALLRGIRWGVGIGAALGLLADLQAGFLIGAHMVSLVSAGAGAGWLAGKIFRDAVIVPAFIVGGLSLLSQGVYLVTANVFGLSLPWGIPFLRPALIAAVYNAVLALGVYPLCLGWLRRTRRGFVVHAEPV